LYGKRDPGKLPQISDPAKYELHQFLLILGIDLDEFYPYAFPGNQVTNFCLYHQVGKVFRRPEPNRKPVAHGDGLEIRQKEPASAEIQNASLSYAGVNGVSGREVDRYSRVFSQVRPIHRKTPVTHFYVYHTAFG
jgi:hypothetical protein